MKKIFALALAALMTAGMTTVAFAAYAEPVVTLGIAGTDSSNTANQVASKDSDGKYTTKANGTVFASEVEGGTKYYIPIMIWENSSSSSSATAIDSGDKFYAPTSDDMKGYRVYADMKVGDFDVDPYIDYVKFDTGYAYAVVVELPEVAGTKAEDIAADLTIAKTKSGADKADAKSKFTFSASYIATTVSDATFDGGAANGIVEFVDDCGEIDIEFGDEAFFTVDATGQGKLNLTWNTDFIEEFADMYNYANIDFLTFEDQPVFNKTGNFYLYASEDAFIYEVTEDGAKAIDATWDEDYEAWTFKTRTLKSYAISDVELTEKTVTEDKDDASSTTDGGKKNPDTGR